VFIDAQGIAAADRRIRLRSILLLFFGGLAASFIAGLLCMAFKAPKFTAALVAVAVSDLSWILGYQLLARERSWVSLRDRFSAVRSGVLWGSAAGAFALILLFAAIGKILQWYGIEFQPIPTPSFLLGGLKTLPVVVLVVAVTGPAAEELMIRGLLLDWLRQRQAVWPAILISALIFGLLHGIALNSGPSGWLQFGYRVLLGILAAYLAVRYRSLRPSFVLHATNNCFVIFAAYFLPI
jgi:hypothetical protein